MKTQEWTHIDKTKWAPGPWANEPDKKQWLDIDTGLPCLAVRGETLGNWCGYVGVSKRHPLFGKDYDDVDNFIDIHGGLTFASKCEVGRKDQGVCHIVEEGENDNVWWFGFDCAHSTDFYPKTMFLSFPQYRTYKTLEFVEAEVKNLAAQLKTLDVQKAGAL